MSEMKNILFFLGYFGSLSLGAGVSPPPRMIHSTRTCDGGIAAFERTVYPLLRRHCASCHDSGGMGPPHSQENVLKSYTRSLSYVDWKNPEDSYLVKKVSLKHWLGYGGMSDLTVEELKSNLREWWKLGQSACSSTFTLTTTPIALSALSTGPSFKTVAWRIGGSIAAAKGAKFELDIALENGSTFLFRRPRLSEHTEALQVSGVEVLFNGSHLPQDHAFRTVEAKLGKSSSPVLSSSTLAVGVSSEEQEISIGFKQIQSTSPPHCKEVENFSRQVLPTLALRSCYRCHGGGDQHFPGESTAKKALPMDLSLRELCSELLQRGSGKFLTTSPLITYPLERANDHPRAIVYPSEVFPSWVDWLAKENL